jgi:hypothetical protein
MQKTICWIAAGLTLLSSAFAADKKQHSHGSNRDSTTYREGSRIRHSDYDPTKLPASNQSTNKELTQIERQVNRNPTVRTPKTATPRFGMAPQQTKPRTDRNVPMNFQYKGPKQAGTTTQARGKSNGRRLR